MNTGEKIKIKIKIKIMQAFVDGKTVEYRQKKVFC